MTLDPAEVQKLTTIDARQANDATLTLLRSALRTSLEQVTGDFDEDDEVLLLQACLSAYDLRETLAETLNEDDAS